MPSTEVYTWKNLPFNAGSRQAEGEGLFAGGVELEVGGLVAGGQAVGAEVGAEVDLAGGVGG